MARAKFRDVFSKYQQATKDLPPEGRRSVAEKVGIRFIEEASLEDEPELQKVWANLLAAAVNNDRPEVTPRYISTAKELMPVEVLFLTMVYDYIVGNSMVPLDARIKLEVSQSWSSKDAIVDIVVHVISLGIVRRFESRLNLGQAFHAGDIKHVTSLADLDTVRLTNSVGTSSVPL